jgi:hypothetical protein
VKGFVRDECSNSMEFSMVEHLVFSLHHSPLSSVDQSCCIVHGPVEKNDEKIRGFESGFIMAIGLGGKK